MNKLLINKYTIFKYLWVIIFFPKPIQLLILLIIGIVKGNRKNKLDLIGLLLSIYIFIYIFSLYINIHMGYYELNRIIAAINSIGIWIVSYIMYKFYKNNQIDMEVLSRYSYINMKILIVLALISYLLFNVSSKSSISLLGRQLYMIDWFNNEGQFRFAGFLDYSNLIIFFYMMFFPTSLIYVKKYKSKIKKYIFLFLSFIPVYFSLSRSGYVIIIISLSIILMNNLKISYNKFNILIILVAITFCILITYKYNIFSFIKLSIDLLMNGRPGSNDTRMYLYKESVRLAYEKSPIWGLGIKSISNTGYPLGSHSTYIGLYYKTGILGLLIVLSIFITLAIRMLKNIKKHREIAVFLSMMMLMFIFEDLDGSNWSIIYYFSLIGIITNVKNCINSNEEAIENSFYSNNKFKVLYHTCSI